MIKRVILYFIGLFCLVPLLFPPDTITVLPKGDLNYRLSPYVAHNDTTKGSLGRFIDTTDSKIVFEYSLDTVNHNPSITPISGFNIIFNRDANSTYPNLKKYEYLDVNIKMRGAYKFIIHVKTLESFTDTLKWWTQRYTYIDEEVEPRGPCLTFEYQTFREPSWWPDMVNYEDYIKMPREPDYTNVMGIDFQNETSRCEYHVPVRMEISKISFRKDLKTRIWICSISFIVWLLGLSIILIIMKFRNRGATDEAEGSSSLQDPFSLNETEPTHIDLKGRDEEDAERLIAYMKNNYQNPDLSSDVVYKETGINPERILVLLRKIFKMSFREYLNFLRIKEAKYQLKETDRNIAEIAFAVGYNSIPHFNRKFRELVRVAPKKFREKERPRKS